MKRQLATLSMTCGLLGLFVTAASAQSYRLASDVPFAFQVSDQSCASGKYTIEKPVGHAYQIIKSKGGCSLILSAGAALNGKSQPKLVFHRYNDQYFLSEIWSNNGAGSRLSVSKGEEKAREQGRTSEIATTTLYLASNR